jgi:nucleoside-diphosphate-sugar epimerase
MHEQLAAACQRMRVRDTGHLTAAPHWCCSLDAPAGFIGSSLVELLLQLGYRVRVLDNLSTGVFSDGAP